jgi:transcriptional regulator of NAD metabolism
MATNRQEVERRILDILTYIENNTLAFPLKQNINLFSLKELEQLLEFLESWNLEPIYNLIDSKYKEYLGLIEELKSIKIRNKMTWFKEEEQKEKEKEQLELNTLLNF